MEIPASPHDQGRPSWASAPLYIMGVGGRWPATGHTMHTHQQLQLQKPTMLGLNIGWSNSGGPFSCFATGRDGTRMPLAMGSLNPFPSIGLQDLVTGVVSFKQVKVSRTPATCPSLPSTCNGCWPLPHYHCSLIVCGGPVHLSATASAQWLHWLPRLQSENIANPLTLHNLCPQGID